jgi:hypothetical protein
MALFADALPNLIETGKKLRAGDIEQPSMAPKTRFNHAVSANRTFDGRAFNLDTVKKMRKAVDHATVNDVIVSVVGGALRKYLDAKGELPHSSLVAFLPINVRTEDEKSSGGNVVSGMTAAIGTNIEDPIERLMTVRHNTQESKEFRIATANAVVEQIEQPFVNLTITNVPGPQIPLYMSGAKLVINFGLGPLINGQGLFVSIMSYCGVLTISFTADRKAIEDPEFFADCLEDAFLELKKATIGIASRSAIPLVKTTVKRKTTIKKAAAPKKKAVKKKAAKKKAAKKKAATKKVVKKKPAAKKKAAKKKVVKKKAVKKKVVAKKEAANKEVITKIAAQ